MTKQPAITDDKIAAALGVYAGMVAHVLAQPERWLGLDEDPPPSAPFPARAVDAVRNRAFGKTTPGSSEWSTLAVDQRVDWWVTRIGISAGLAAAAPRVAGALSDRVPLQAALGASAAGLAVCATAREYGRPTPAEWVPLLSQVLFDRELTVTPTAVPDSEVTEQRLAAAAEEEDADGALSKLSDGAQRTARTLWRLARTFLELQRLLDERPRGSFLARTLAKVPVVGVAGGWLDERGGVRKASRSTAALLQ